MKVKQKQPLPFGDLITAEYEARGSGPAEKLMRVASNACLVVVYGSPQLAASVAAGRVG